MAKLSDFKRFEVLGRGATATVYRAQNIQTQSWRALKVFHPNLLSLDSSLQQQRIRNEFRVGSKLEHPSIVAIQELIIEDGQAAVVMPLIEGQSLENFQSRLPYVLPELSVMLVLEILRALEYAHAQKVIHRDLKPSNILIAQNGDVFVVDFGLARWEEGSAHTTTGSILGSPDFMSPEQAQGHAATVASDLFSISGILYFLVTGTRPFSRGTPLATLAAVVKGDFEAAPRRNPKLNLRLSEIIAKGLSKDFAQRYKSAGEFRQCLEQYCEDLGLASYRFKDWVQNPQDFVYQCLSLIAENLTLKAERLLGQGQWQNAALSLSHLSLVAPESQSILHLSQALERSRRKKVFWKKALPVAAVASLVGVSLATFLFLRSSPEENISPVATSPVVEQNISNPVTEHTAPTELTEAVPAAETPAEEIATPPPAPVEKPKVKASADVIFEVSDEVEVSWNGRRMKPGTRLRRQPYGRYRLKLIRPGFAPINQSIDIQSPEAVYIRAQ